MHTPTHNGAHAVSQSVSQSVSHAKRDTAMNLVATTDDFSTTACTPCQVDGSKHIDWSCGAYSACGKRSLLRLRTPTACCAAASCLPTSYVYKSVLRKNLASIGCVQQKYIMSYVVSVAKIKISSQLLNRCFENLLIAILQNMLGELEVHMGLHLWTRSNLRHFQGFALEP